MDIVLAGVVGGITVVLGVAVAEALTRARSRWELILDRIQELNIILPKFITSFMRRPGFPSPNDPGFPILFERVLSCLADIRFNARFPLRRHSSIRHEAEDLTARVMAALWVWEEGGALSVEDVANIGVRQIRGAVLGKQHPTLEKLAEEYQKNGFPPYPEDEE